MTTKTGIELIQISDATFQTWLDTTNEVVDLVNENVMLAAPGAGFTTVGNSTLQGTFTANTVTATSASATSLSVETIGHAIDPDSNIVINSPVRILSPSNLENMLEIKTNTGERPIVGLINGANGRWDVALSGSNANSGFTISTPGAETPQVLIATSGNMNVLGRVNTVGVVLTEAGTTNTSAVRADRLISSGAGLTGGGNLTADRTLSLAGQALALHSLSSNGIITRTGSAQIAARSIENGNGITVTNGNGVSGNPTIAIDTDVVVTRTGDQTIGGVKTFSAYSIHTGYIVVRAGSTQGGQVILGYTGSGAITNEASNTWNVDVNPNNTFRIFRKNSAGTTDIVMQIPEAAGTAISFARPITSSGDITAFSDMRLKTNVRTIDGALDKVSLLRGVYFDRDGKAKIGVIAQEVEEVLPEVVSNEGEYKSVAYGNMTAVLIEAIKELRSQVEDLKKQLNDK